MRYRVTGAGWRLGNVVVPAGTVIDTNADDRWSKRARGEPPPLTVVPLDREALEALVQAYPDHKHLLPGGWV